MINIYLTDFSHKKFYVRCFPYPIGLLAGYALREIGNKVSIQLFKDFDEFREAVKAKKPDVVGFSNYMWNGRLGSMTAEIIKREIPDIICVMGGPNYDVEPESQQNFLQNYPAIDFYVYREGEIAFTSLIKLLIQWDMDTKGLKSAGIEIPSVHYLDSNGRVIRGELMSRIKTLDEIPSPYLTGIMDKFFDQDLSVLAQRTRGCPFSCTFCGEGLDYYSKVARFGRHRFESELRYCAERLRNKPGRAGQLILADANFGMFPEDLDAAEQLAKTRHEYGWPEKIDVATGKNKKERILQVVNKINEGGTNMIRLTASVQSTDAQVLQNIKRSNISVNALVKNSTRNGSLAYGEVILGLPGDNFEAHTKSIKSLIDDGIKKVQSQFLVLLPGTEMASSADRQKYGYRTAFRVMPGAYGMYDWEDRSFQSFEMVEMVVANNTLSLEDYLRCCEFDLTIECFFNNRLFDEYIGLLEFVGLPISGYMDEIFALRKVFPPKLEQAYRDFRETRSRELWENKLELIRFYEENPERFKERIANEYRGSLATIRSILIFSCMAELNAVAHQATINYLEGSGRYNGYLPDYLREASINSYARKQALLEDVVLKHTLHYNFVALHELDFRGDLSRFAVPTGIDIVYRPHRKLLSRCDYCKRTEPDEIVIWRKLLFETRIDQNDDFCRLMELDGTTKIVASNEKQSDPHWLTTQPA